MIESQIMSGAWIATDGDGRKVNIDNAKTEGHLAGRVVGLEKAEKAILDKAGKAFGAGLDNQAKALRDLAKEINAEVKEARGQLRAFQANYPTVVEREADASNNWDENA